MNENNKQAEYDFEKQCYENEQRRRDFEAGIRTVLSAEFQDRFYAAHDDLTCSEFRDKIWDAYLSKNPSVGCIPKAWWERLKAFLKTQIESCGELSYQEERRWALGEPLEEIQKIEKGE